MQRPMFRSLFTAGLSIAALCAPIAHAPAFAAPAASASRTTQDDHIIHVVRKGDTLITLADAWFVRPADYRAVQKLNNIADPFRIPVGFRLKIPHDVLRFRATNATVVSFRGQVAIRKAAQSINAAKGGKLGEGTVIVTGPNSSISLSLEDGSTFTLPSNSRVRLARLRHLLLPDSIDYELALENGRAQTRVAPLRKPEGRYRLRTPVAVSAVRGTEFRNGYDEASATSLAELVEGALIVATDKGDGADTNLTPGKGLVASASGVTVEQLLSAPGVVSGIGTQRDVLVSFKLAPDAQAQRYKLVIARDSALLDIVAEGESNVPELQVADLANGNYFAQMSAVAASGLEGMPTNVAFKRRLSTVTATAGATDDGFRFSWTGAGEGTALYHLQITRQPESGQSDIIVDEPALASDHLLLSDLPPGKYRWRVGKHLFAEGEHDQVWTEFQDLTVGE